MIARGWGRAGEQRSDFLSGYGVSFPGNEIVLELVVMVASTL